MCKNRELGLRLSPQVLLPLGEPDHGPGTWPEDTMLGLEHITYPILIILVSNHTSTYCFLMFFGELLADGTPHGPFPSSRVLWSQRGPIVMRYQVASNHERLEVRCERVEQKTR
jgi:hypothetical protein